MGSVTQIKVDAVPLILEDVHHEVFFGTEEIGHEHAVVLGHFDLHRVDVVENVEGQQFEVEGGEVNLGLLVVDSVTRVVHCPVLATSVRVGNVHDIRVHVCL